jgi:hypothetical protein
MTAPFSDPKAIAEAGEAIYRDMYQKDYEQNQRGKFVAININTKAATLGDTAGDALLKAKKADPHGIFHLIRVGFTGAFQLSRRQRATEDCLLK